MEKGMGMGRGTNPAILLTMAFLVVTRAVNMDPNGARSFPKTEEIDRKMNVLNKAGVKTIKSKDGDIIDYVDIHKQPAFDHPLLKNHKIQMRPSAYHPTPLNSIAKNDSSPEQEVLQTWQRSGSCPDGTIPIRRVRKEDLLRADSLHHFGRRNPANVSYATVKPNDLKLPNNIKASVPLIDKHATAVLVTGGYNYIGAQGDINVWNPRVALRDDYTTAQIWLRAGHSHGFDSVEGGWAVHPKLYGDKRTRLFAYWTTDSYGSTGCFDLTCSGFVQTSKRIALGAAIEPVSSLSGKQYKIAVDFSLDYNTASWWLTVQGVPIGYWPPTLFRSLGHSATMVHWGGQVYSSSLKTPHTGTAMGSGDMARNLFGSACFIRNVRIQDYSLQLKYPQWVGTYADQPNCYSAYNYIESYGVLPVFYFGGPGRSLPYCP